MSFDTLRQDIEQRMVDNWAENATVEYENLPFDKPSNVEWVRLTVTTGQGETQGIAGSTVTVRDTGMVSLQVFAPEGTGTKTSKALVDAFIAIFEHARFNGITTYTASVSSVGNDGYGWHQTNVTVPFRRSRNV